MTEIRPEELSGLLDGELSEERDKVVRQAIESDPELRRQFEEWERLHFACVQSAEEATFVPSVIPALRDASSSPRLLKAIVALLCLRIVFKLSPFLIVTVAETVLLGVLIFWGVRYISQLTETAFKSTFETT